MDVDRSKLKACDGYASAEQLPKAVDILFAGSPAERKLAYWQIDNHVVVQGGLYESAPYTARLIVDKLKADPARLNVEILDLLFELANGNARGELVQHGPLQGQSIRQLCRKTVAEALPIVSAAQARSVGSERQTIDDLLDSYEQDIAT